MKILSPLPKRLFTVLALLIAVVASAQTYDSLLMLDHDDGINIEFSEDNSLAMMKHVKRFNKYNSWYIYRVVSDENGTLQLEGIAEVKVANRNDNFVAEEIPAAVTITGIDTDSPKVSGKFNSNLKKVSRGIYDREWSIAKSLADYRLHPEDYNADSVARLRSDANALVNSYQENQAIKRISARREKAEKEEREMTSNMWILALLLIPLIASIVLGPLTSGDSIASGFSGKAKAIALTEIVGFAIILLCVHSIYSRWWVIVLAVIAFAVIQIYNIFFGWATKDYVTDTLRVSFPWLPAVVFAVVGMFIPMALFSVTAVLAGGGVMESSTGEMVLGALLTIALACLAGWWYKSALTSRVPELKGDFLSIAVITVFAAFGVLTLFVFVIAFAIFRVTGKMALSQSEKDGSSKGLSKSSDSCRTCNFCGRLGSSSCPYLRSEGSAVLTCDSWMP